MTRRRRGGLQPVFAIFRQDLLRLGVGILLGLAAIAAGIGLLSLSGWFISAAAIAGLSTLTAGLFNFFLPSIGVRLFAVTRTAARYAERVVNHDATFRILENLRVWSYRKIEPLAPGGVHAFRSGDLLNRIVADINALDNLYVRVAAPTVVALLTTGLVTAALWWVDPLTAMVTAALILLAGGVIPGLAAAVGFRHGIALARAQARLRVQVLDTCQGLTDWMMFNAVDRQQQRVRSAHGAVIAAELRMHHISGISSAMVTLTAGISVTAALWLGTGLVERGMLGGDLLAMVTFGVMAVYEAVNPLFNAYQYLGHTREAGRRLTRLVQTPPAVVFPEQPTHHPRGTGICFRGVTYRYREHAPPAVADIRLDIGDGQRVAIMGHTGSGKTTLVHLLTRFHDPDEGRLAIGEVDLADLAEPQLRSLMSVVSQQAHIFSASVRDNLLIARPDASDADLMAALKRARLNDVVERLPEGLDTWVGETGRLLSGGQARRLVIARAILHDAPIWILDEPTEGLDPLTEKAVMAELLDITAGRTLLLITHRPVALERVDRIVVMDGGRIIESGTHDELLARNGRYAALVPFYAQCDRSP